MLELLRGRRGRSHGVLSRLLEPVSQAEFEVCNPFLRGMDQGGEGLHLIEKVQEEGETCVGELPMIW